MNLPIDDEALFPFATLLFLEAKFQVRDKTVCTTVNYIYVCLYPLDTR
jgi:hypothetical protein